MRPKRPFVGLSVTHTKRGRPNIEAREWVKGKLADLYSKGYRRVVVEGEPRGHKIRYFNNIAEAARGLGFEVIREPQKGVERHNLLVNRMYHPILRLLAISEGEIGRGLREKIAKESVRFGERGSHRSVKLADLLFEKPGTVLVSADGHTMQIMRHIAHQRGVEFKPKFHPSSDKKIAKKEADKAWGEYEKLLERLEARRKF